jgi:hypothetical protein
LLESKGDYIHTFTGKTIRPFAPDVEKIDIRDIAHALALTNRWRGHTRVAMSVAEHSVRVSMICPARDALWGLLHDASEAYLGDIPRPIKSEADKAAEAVMQVAIAERFGLTLPIPASVHRADTVLLHTEARDLFPRPIQDEWRDERLAQPGRLNPLTWQAAEAWFLERYRRLERQRGKVAA